MTALGREEGAGERRALGAGRAGRESGQGHGLLRGEAAP